MAAGPPSALSRLLSFHSPVFAGLRTYPAVTWGLSRAHPGLFWSGDGTKEIDAGMLRWYLNTWCHWGFVERLDRVLPSLGYVQVKSVVSTASFAPGRASNELVQV